MRLPKEMVDYLAKALAERLTKEGFIAIKGPQDEVEGRIKHVIMEDLLVEDRLNEEVKELLREYASEIDKREVDYSRMFNLIKSKLVKERGLIL
ncbi:MAG: hypothetical protein A3G93_03605 [Nitrospinae bacterium RIFCSPLOWO2_12_FULL_45_22]|nr:MAG: hypothetical protein A3G93_03605 [Nitrospinae bacterium RIFCSPLOWO2_12_FULL_45_22]